MLFLYLSIYGVLHTRRRLSGLFSLMQNNLGSNWSKFTVNIAKFAEDPWLSEYEEKIICYERKKTNMRFIMLKNTKKIIFVPPVFKLILKFK